MICISFMGLLLLALFSVQTCAHMQVILKTVFRIRAFCDHLWFIFIITG
jgi:hypothetical protein